MPTTQDLIYKVLNVLYCELLAGLDDLVQVRYINVSHWPHE